MTVTTIALSNTFDEWRIAFNEIVTISNTQLDSAVLATLTTTVNATLVGAINELHAEHGDLTTLTTIDKTTFVNAINEINSAISGFAELATANTFTQSQTIDKAGALGVITIGSDIDTGETTQIDALGHNSVGANTTYARICQSIIDNTDTSEDGSLVWKTMVAGTLATRMSLAQGMWMDGATGGDQGAGTINCTGIFVDGNPAVGGATPNRQVIIATEGQTVFVISGGYEPTNVDVHKNGSLLVQGDDYNVDAGVNITLTIGAVADDVINVVTFLTAGASLADKDQVVKSSANFDGVGSITLGFNNNITGIVRNSAGNYTITWDTDFVDTAYVVCVTHDQFRHVKIAKTVGTYQFELRNVSDVATDSDDVNVIAMGEQ